MKKVFRAMALTPCNKTCKLVMDICIGCLRNSNQIRMWSTYTEKEKIAVMNTIEAMHSVRIIMNDQEIS